MQRRQGAPVEPADMKEREARGLGHRREKGKEGDEEREGRVALPQGLQRGDDGDLAQSEPGDEPGLQHRCEPAHREDHQEGEIGDKEGQGGAHRSALRQMAAKGDHREAAGVLAAVLTAGMHDVSEAEAGVSGGRGGITGPERQAGGAQPERPSFLHVPAPGLAPPCAGMTGCPADRDGRSCP